MQITPTVLAAALALTAELPATDYYLYFLGGQSNMDGYGQVAQLPEALRGPVAGVRIFHGNPAADGVDIDGAGIWAELRPGHGVGFSSDGSKNDYSNRFGVELTFARALRAAKPDRKIAILKYSRGGTSIAIDAAMNFGCWDPDYERKNGINQWDHFLNAVRLATTARDIDGDGEADRLIPAGILWMQGESDAQHTAATAKAYRANLRRLMDLIRAAFRVDDIPVVIGRISNSADAKSGPKNRMSWKHAAIVRQAQADYVEADGHAALVTETDSYGYSDPWHYDSAGYIDLGRRFAAALLSIE